MHHRHGGLTYCAESRLWRPRPLRQRLELGALMIQIQNPKTLLFSQPRRAPRRRNLPGSKRSRRAGARCWFVLQRSSQIWRISLQEPSLCSARQSNTVQSRRMCLQKL